VQPVTMSLVAPFSLALLSMAWGPSGPPAAHQQTVPGALDLVGQVGARARAAAVQDDRLYLAAGSQVKVLAPAGLGGGFGQIAQSGVGKSAIDQLVPLGGILYARNAASDLLAFAGLGTSAVAVGCQGMLRWLDLAEGQGPHIRGSLQLPLDSYVNRPVALAPELVIAAGYLGVEIVAAPGLRAPRPPRLFLPAALTP